MKDKNGKILHNGKEYRLVFNLNAMQAIQEEYGTLSAWGKLTDSKDENGEEQEPNLKALIFGLTAMINEGIDIENEENGTNHPLLTLKQVGRMISDVGINQASAEMNSTVVKSTESAEKNA